MSVYVSAVLRSLGEEYPGVQLRAVTPTTPRSFPDSRVRKDPAEQGLPEALVCTYQELPKPEEPFLPPQGCPFPLSFPPPREQTLHIPTEVECAFSSLNACSDLISKMPDAPPPRDPLLCPHPACRLPQPSCVFSPVFFPPSKRRRTAGLAEAQLLPPISLHSFQDA